eukprot:TRINITY_DN2552_c0_g3_i1.p1 TRINITY_DN2552_c0_g3~~TRINITY_DN2552_c0_g3_i1.p1  ORF type:complete len:870 (+),score=101.98 TRINITY_DN2552_c0_g3_i1:253-2862(+)
MSNGESPRWTFEKLFNIDSSVSTKFSNLAFKRSDSDNSILTSILSSSSSDDSWLDYSVTKPAKSISTSKAVIDLTEDSPQKPPAKDRASVDKSLKTKIRAPALKPPSQEFSSQKSLFRDSRSSSQDSTSQKVSLTRDLKQESKKVSLTRDLKLLSQDSAPQKVSLIRDQKPSSQDFVLPKAKLTRDIKPLSQESQKTKSIDLKSSQGSQEVKLTRDLVYKRESKLEQISATHSVTSKTSTLRSKPEPIVIETKAKIVSKKLEADVKVRNDTTKGLERKETSRSTEFKERRPSLSVNSKPQLSGNWKNQSATKKRKRGDSELWIDKYKPLDKATLCVPTKKYESVVDALTQAFKGVFRVIFLVGPPGCGKTACLDVICKLIQVEKVEWLNPAQLPGLAESIMNPFTDFVVREKYPTLDFEGDATKKKKHKVVVIEDIPNLHNITQQEQFVALVESIVYSKSTALGPVVFIVSDSTKENNAIMRLIPESLSEQNNPAVKMVRFNPVIQRTLMSVLKRIAEKEDLSVTTEGLQKIADNSNGDVRNAINSLQFSESKSDTKLLKGKEPVKRGRTKKKSSSVTASSGKDASLSLFHALGKVLYNKRLPATEALDGPRARAPMKSEPNKFRKHVHVESSLFSQFIAENYLTFFSDIHDAAEASEYLSQSVCMISGDKAQQWSTNMDLDLQSWHVATTGIMYANAHPVPNNWKPLYKPHAHTVNRVRKNNKEIMLQLYMSVSKNSGTSESSRLHNIDNKTVSTDIVPYLSLICDPKPQNRKFVPGAKPQPAKSSLTPSQRSWMDMIGTYSTSTTGSIHSALGVERGSTLLTEYDNHYKMHLQSTKSKFRLEAMDQEVLDRMNQEALQDDDIEEWSD